MFTGPEPSAALTNTSRFPERSLVKAIFDPSGDQAGSRSAPGEFVMFTGPEPSAALTNTSEFPTEFERKLEKAIFDPSGDQAGSRSSPG